MSLERLYLQAWIDGLHRQAHHPAVRPAAGRTPPEAVEVLGGYRREALPGTSTHR